jgi:hypothetical protein
MPHKGAYLAAMLAGNAVPAIEPRLDMGAEVLLTGDIWPASLP